MNILKAVMLCLLNPGFSKCAFLHSWTLWECCTVLHSKSGQCRENSSVESLQTSWSPQKSVSCQSIPLCWTGFLSRQPWAVACWLTWAKSVKSHSSGTSALPGDSFLGKTVPPIPTQAPFSLNLALKANLKSQTGNDRSSKRPRSFHHHLSIKSNTWADCQAKLPPPKKCFFF